MLKRTVEALLERGAIVRNLENLGERALPYKISKHKERHKRGGYVVTPFLSPLPVLLLKMHISNKPGVFLGLFLGFRWDLGGLGAVEGCVCVLLGVFCVFCSELCQFCVDFQSCFCSLAELSST